MKWLAYTLAVVLSWSFAFGQSGWTVQNAGYSTQTRSIKSLNRQIGWISADNGVIRRTTNGGLSWDVIQCPTSAPYCIAAIDSLTAMVGHYGASATIYRTSDGGAHWVSVFEQPGGFIDALIMLDRNTGFALGDPVNGKWTVLKTTNGGVTWLPFDNQPLQIGSEYGWTQSFCTIGTRYLWFGSSESKIYRSTDAGVSWSYSTAPSTLCSAVSFADSLHGVAGFLDGSVAYSSDGGVTWNSTPVPGAGSIWGIATDGVRNFWLPRADTVFVSTDWGRNWQSQFASPFGGYLRDIHFSKDGSTISGWVGSSGGEVARYVGASPPTLGWTVQNSGVTNILYTVKAVDHNVGWAAGLGGAIIRTVNGGNTWRSVGIASNLGIPSIDALDSNSALVAASTTQSGGDGFIYRTTNGGSTWTLVYSLIAPGAFIDCIRMLNANYGVAIGDPVQGKWVVLKTTDGGATWFPTPTQPDQIGSEWGAPHMLVVQSETDFRFVSGRGSTRMYRTTDGGSTWSNYLLPFGNAYSLSLHFNGPLIGVAGASTYTVARTTDGGVTWNTIPMSGGGTWGLTGYDSTFYAVNWATIYISTDNGLNWSESYAPGFGQLADISFVKGANSVRGWAIGGHSIAAYTEL